MRLTPNAVRRSAIAGASLVAAAATIGLAAPGANAAFTLGDCGATSAAQFKGQGSSFQGDAQTYWKTVFTSSNGCGGATPAPDYFSTSSGGGNAAMGAGNGTNLNCGGSGCTQPSAKGFRDPTTRFAGTDEPPNATTISDMTDGLTGQTGDGTGDTAGDHTQRVRITNEHLEQAFAGQIQTWGDLVPGITGCDTTQIIRIVRTSPSGTTLGFKTFLDKINPGRGWLTTYGGGAPSWPKGAGDPSATGPTKVSGTGAYGGTAPYLAGPETDGGGNLALTVASNPGSIGYAALSDARKKGFEVTPGATQDPTYWVPLQDLRTTGATYHEPSTDAAAHKPGVGARGSSCGSAPITGIPTGSDPTLGDWSKTNAVGTATYNGYPDCLITYELAWDDNAPVYGNTSAEEQNARAVKDYLSKAVVSTAGQLFFNTDYSSLPANLLTVAQNGVASIGWNKSASSGGGSTTTATTTPAATTAVATPPAVVPPVVTKPSNAFSLTSSKASSTGLTFKVQLPGAGKLTAVATAKSGKKTIKVGTVTATANGAGTVTLTIKLSSAAKSAIKKAKGKKLSVKTVVAFLPNGGSAASKSKSLTVKAAKTKSKK